MAVGQGHHHAAFGVVNIVAMAHPLAGVHRVEVHVEALHGAHDDSVLSWTATGDGKGMPMQVHRVKHCGVVEETKPNPLALTDGERA